MRGRGGGEDDDATMLERDVIFRALLRKIPSSRGGIAPFLRPLRVGPRYPDPDLGSGGSATRSGTR